MGEQGHAPNNVIGAQVMVAKFLGRIAHML
jgi:hypothetical protein